MGGGAKLKLAPGAIYSKYASVKPYSLGNVVVVAYKAEYGPACML